jgi:menaquinone-dependent protoporphyrinogen oxidase
MMKENHDKQKKISRRSFLKTAAIGCGAAVVVCAGAGTLASLPPAVDFYESEGDAGGGMQKSVLVAYASKAGSTAEVAQAIAETISGRGMAAAVKPIDHVKSLEGYDAVVIGSCIRMGGWLPEALKFVEKNQGVLKTLPTAFFQVSAGMRENTPAAKEEALGYSQPARDLLEPVSMGLFAGKMDLSKLSLFDRAISKMVGSVEGDWRDWEAIRAWAEAIETL